MTTTSQPQAASRKPNAAWLRATPLFLAVLLMGGLSTPLRAAGTEVITSPDRAGIQINRELLRAVFTMRLRAWPDGAPVRVFVLPDEAPLHEEFSRAQLGMYPYVLRNTWDRLVFTGTGLAPTVVHSEEEMRRKVRSTPGAIGYVSAGSGASVVELRIADRESQ